MNKSAMSTINRYEILLLYVYLSLNVCNGSMIERRYYVDDVAYTLTIDDQQFQAMAVWDIASDASVPIAPNVAYALAEEARRDFTFPKRVWVLRSLSLEQVDRSLGEQERSNKWVWIVSYGLVPDGLGGYSGPKFPNFEFLISMDGYIFKPKLEKGGGS